MRMTKSDFPLYDFAGLEYATRIEVTSADASTKEYRVLNYWPGGGDRVDVAECVDETVFVEAPVDERCPILTFPDPRIHSVKVLTRGDTPNRQSHPEIAFDFPLLETVFSTTKDSR